MKTCEIIIYTSGGALSFEVIETVDNFRERLASFLEEGTVALDTVEGSQLIINSVNVVAVEIRNDEESERGDTPRL